MIRNLFYENIQCNVNVSRLFQSELMHFGNKHRKGIFVFGSEFDSTPQGSCPQKWDYFYYPKCYSVSPNLHQASFRSEKYLTASQLICLPKIGLETQFVAKNCNCQRKACYRWEPGTYRCYEFDLETLGTLWADHLSRNQTWSLIAPAHFKVAFEIYLSSYQLQSQRTSPDGLCSWHCTLR